MLDQAHISGIQNIRGLILLLDHKGLIRTGTLDQITADGRATLIDLGIVTELDLRRQGEGGAAGAYSNVAECIENYIHISGIYYVDGSSGLAVGSDTFAREVAVFADPENYPILMHCSAGRDRTGCLSLVLQALCGASKEDIIRDYELSFLSVNGCSDDAGTVTVMNAQLERTLNYIEEIGGGDTFTKSVENFLLEIGVTEDEIASIREILIEDVE
ncbi:MAG: tyrosine-protein phosphatase [Clostridia bacterium]|nr:tyrosine-protein phosphatase [Clostridia bacterium]